MDLQKGDLVIYDGEEYEVQEIPELRSKIRITDGKYGKWVNRNEVERVYKFRENEKCYYRTSYENYECTIEAKLSKKDKPWYVIYVPEWDKYKLVMEFQLLKRKDFDDLKEDDSFFLPSGEKIRIDKIVFDDYEGVYKYLIKREHGEIRLVHKEILKGWL